MSRTTLVLALGVPLIASDVFGAIVRVPEDYPTIQAGVDAAVEGDTVVVGPGEYSDWETRFLPGIGDVSAAVFLKSGVLVTSSAGPESTTIRLPWMGNGFGIWAADLAVAYVSGLTIRSDVQGNYGALIRYCGEATVENCHFLGLDPLGGAGSGVRCFQTSLTIKDCLFEDCVGIAGAGLWHRDGDVMVTGTTFRNCGNGGAWLETLPPGVASVVVEDCLFEGNFGSGPGGISANSRWVTVERCTFDGNSATIGPVAAELTGGDTVIRDCVVLRSGPTISTLVSATGFSSVLVEANTIHGAEGDGNPGAAVALAPGAVLRGNVITGARGGTAVTGGHSGGCNVFFDNEFGAGIDLHETDVIADPIYCDVEEGDLRVRSDSPCLPENSPQGCGLIGALGEGCGTVSVDRETWGRVKARFRDPEGEGEER
jgi:hypothetical protein